MGILSNHLKKLDWNLIVSAVLIVFFGLSAIYSSGLAKSDFSNLEKQVIFFVVGFLLMLFISFLDYKFLRNNSYLILVF